MSDKNYVKCSLVEQPSIFSGYYGTYSISEDILIKLSKDLGFSFELYSTLSTLDKDTAEKLVISMSKKNNHEEISLLLDDESSEVLGYSLESSRVPLLNDEFIKRVTSLVETSQEIEISEKYHASDDLKASVIIKKKSPIEVDLGSSKATYEIGVLLFNDELETTYGRFVIFLEGQPIYLPASYYNVSTSRYKRSTGTSVEALEVLVLKIIDDLREEEMKPKLYDFHMKYRVCKETLTTYEEYNTVLRTMMRIPSIIDDHSFLDSLSSKYEEFEQKYAHLDDQKSSYIWRCTAMGELTIGALIHITIAILNELNAPAMEYYNIREILGTYLSTSRIAAEIAKEDI